MKINDSLQYKQRNLVRKAITPSASDWYYGPTVININELYDVTALWQAVRETLLWNSHL